MVKRNYRAWNVDASRFDHQSSDIDKLLNFARYAVLAPSGHNTQPWLLSTAGASLQIAIHPDRHLSIDGSGLLSVEPYISIGTFLEVLHLAAKGFGYRLGIKLFPGGQYVADVRIMGHATPEPRLLDAIKTRVSNRTPYRQTPLDKNILLNLTKHSLSGIDFTIVSNRDDIEFVGEQTGPAITKIMNNPLYRTELSQWVRTNQTRKYDGMPGFTHGFGSIQSLVSKAAVKHAPTGGPQAKKSRALIVHSGALVIVRCKDDKKESFVNAGRLYSQICVLANDSGIASSALGAAVLDSTSRETIKKHFGIEDRPIYILRLGKAAKASRHSPRWPTEKLMSR